MAKSFENLQKLQNLNLEGSYFTQSYEIINEEYYEEANHEN